MAVIPFTVTPLKTHGDTTCVIASWAPLTHSGTDSGSPLEVPGALRCSVQVTGTFGASGTLLIEGSNDGTNYATLADPQGSALSVTSAKIEEVLEAVRYIRPRVSNGDGTTSLTCTLLVRK
jgi:hypothetical protein